MVASVNNPFTASKLSTTPTQSDAITFQQLLKGGVNMFKWNAFTDKKINIYYG